VYSVLDKIDNFVIKLYEGVQLLNVSFSLQVICHSGELDSGLSILREMKVRGVQPDVATFNTLLASASYHVSILS